jgi:hypothetical protein
LINIRENPVDRERTMKKKEKETNDISRRDGEIWGPATYYFFCPACDKSYTIDYDASSRKDFNGRFEANTCIITTVQCRFCSTDLSIAYSADHLEVIAYDTAEEEQWAGLFAAYSAHWNKLKKTGKKLKKRPDKSLQKKKDAAKKACRKLARALRDSEEHYTRRCDERKAARERQESLQF